MAGDDDGEADASIEDEIDAIARDAEDGLADEVEDGAADGRADDGGMEEGVEGAVERVAADAFAGAFDQLADTAQVGERIGEDGDGGDEEQSGAADFCECDVDGEGGGAFHEELIDAEKPEGRTPEGVGAAGFEQARDYAGEDRERET